MPKRNGLPRFRYAYTGAIYHLINRGNYRPDVFESEPECLRVAIRRTRYVFRHDPIVQSSERKRVRENERALLGDCEHRDLPRRRRCLPAAFHVVEEIADVELHAPADLVLHDSPAVSEKAVELA